MRGAAVPYFDPAVGLLVRMKTWGAARKLLRSLLKPQGFVLSFVIAGSFYFLIVHGNEAYTGFRSAFVSYGWLVLFVLTFIVFEAGLASQHIYFRKSEVQFLIAAPIAREDVLLYHLLNKLKYAVLVSSPIALAASWEAFLHPFMRLFPAVLVALLLPLAMTAARQRLSPKAHAALQLVSEGLGYATYAIAGLIAVAMSFPAGRATLLDILNSSALREALAPFVMANILLLRPGAQATLLWAAPLSLVAAVCTYVVLRFYDLEWRTEKSEETGKRVEKMRTRGLTLRRFSIFEFSMPALPYLYGVGPPLWRRCQEWVRHVPQAMGLLLFALISFCFLASTVLEDTAGTAPLRRALLLCIAAQANTVVITFIVAHFDLKEDTRRLEWIKALPISPSAMILGRSLPLAAYTSLLLCLMAGLAQILGQQSPEHLLFMVWALPLGFTYAFAATAIFLAFPAVAGPQSLSGIYRYLSALIAVFTAPLLGMEVLRLCWRATLHFGQPQGFFLLSSTLAYFLAAVLSFMGCVWAYKRVDVSA